jgi:hypothetical protein
VPCTCSVAAPPWAQVLGLCPGLPQVQAREPGRVPCSHRIWSLTVLHGIPGRRGYSGGEWMHPWGGVIFCFISRRDHNFFLEGNAIAFLIPRTALRGFLPFSILTTHRRNFLSTSEGLLRPGALASIGLSSGFAAQRTGLWARPRPGALGGALIMPRAPRKTWSVVCGHCGPGLCLCFLPRNFRLSPKLPGVAMESCLIQDPSEINPIPSPRFFFFFFNYLRPEGLFERRP